MKKVLAQDPQAFPAGGIGTHRMSRSELEPELQLGPWIGLNERLPGSRQPQRFTRMIHQILAVGIIGGRKDQAHQKAQLGDGKAGFGGAPRQKLLVAMMQQDQFLSGGRVKPAFAHQGLNFWRKTQDELLATRRPALVPAERRRDLLEALLVSAVKFVDEPSLFKGR